MHKLAIISTVHDARDPRIAVRIPLSLRKKYDVHVITGFNDAHADAALFRKQYCEHITWHPLPILSSQTDRIKRQRIVYQMLRKEKPDIVWCNDPELLPLCFSIRSLQNSKIVFDLHEDVFDLGYPQNFLKKQLVMLGLKRADLVITAFELALRPYHPVPERPNMALLNYYPTETLPESLLNRENSFLYSGIVHKSRGLDLYLSVLETLVHSDPQTKGIIAGRCYVPDHWNWLLQKIREKNLAQHLTILGGHEFVSWFTIQRLQMEAKLGSLLYPRNELNWKFPTRIYEFSALELPYIAIPIPSFLSFNETYGGGIFIEFTTTGTIINPNILLDWWFTPKNLYHQKKAPDWSSQELLLFENLSRLLS